MRDPLDGYFAEVREAAVPESVRQFQPEARWQRELALDFSWAAASVMLVLLLAKVGERGEVSVPQIDPTWTQWRQLSAELGLREEER
ncbi:MAG: hypothetical protein SFX74_13135 [Fimbriimonadaceae bacterium]|nr:hypothetical protein [Fimbriimonadaceae bacterium]